MWSFPISIPISRPLVNPKSLRQSNLNFPFLEVNLEAFQSFSFVKFNLKKNRGALCSSHSCLEIRDLRYRPPGTQLNLLNNVTLTLPEKRSGSGKTTLLQLIAGLTKPTAGSISIQSYTHDGLPNHPPHLLSPQTVGILFQFPERYFVADNVFDEITFGLPRQKTDLKVKQLIATRLERAIASVGLNGISLDKNPNSLSGGYKRRLALAIQLVQSPEILVLDEPLAGLDWKARADVVKLLKDLKKELTILVVSHDLKELAPLVDRSWRMDVGGLLTEEPLPI